MKKAVLTSSDELDRFIAALEGISEVALDLHPSGHLAKRLVRIIQRGLSLRGVERESLSAPLAGNVETALCPDLSEGDWRFLAAMIALNISRADDHETFSPAA